MSERSRDDTGHRGPQATRAEPADSLEAAFQTFSSPFAHFLRRQSTSSIFLFIATLTALVCASTGLREGYEKLVEFPIGLFAGDWGFVHPLREWINDGLMVLFFFVLGLEVKRELIAGQLKDRRQAALVGLAAFGGMLFPGVIHTVINFGEESLRGWAIPVATDAAFALGVVAILGARVPVGVVTFLAAFAIVDDIGAVLIIALFYTDDLNWRAVFLAGLALGLLITLNRLGVRRITPYLLGSIALWSAVWSSGVHATVAGVLAALTVPARAGLRASTFERRVGDLLRQFKRHRREGGEDLLGEEEQHAIVDDVREIARTTETPLRHWENALQTPVALLVVPLFALTNAGVTISAESLRAVWSEPGAIGIVLGLVLGKSLGITLVCHMGLRTGLAALPEGVNSGHLLGAAIVAGMGFTMSLFVANLAYDPSTALLEEAKLAILVGSLVCALAGCAVLWRAGRDQRPR